MLLAESKDGRSEEREEPCGELAQIQNWRGSFMSPAYCNLCGYHIQPISNHRTHHRFSKSGTTDFDPNGPLTLINEGLHRIHNRSFVSHFSPIMDARSVLRKKAIPLTEASFLIVNWQEKEERCSDRSWGWSSLLFQSVPGMTIWWFGNCFLNLQHCAHILQYRYTEFSWCPRTEYPLSKEAPVPADLRQSHLQFPVRLSAMVSVVTQR